MVMNIWKMLFERNSRVLRIELNDKKIDSDISAMIVEMQRIFQAILDTQREHNYDAKQGYITQLQEHLVDVRKKLFDIHKDVHAIIDLEKSEASYIRINDNSFIIDKLNQITLIISNLDMINDIVTSCPTDDEYKKEFYVKIKDSIKEIKISIDKIFLDDRELQGIYEKILDL